MSKRSQEELEEELRLSQEYTWHVGVESVDGEPLVRVDGKVIGTVNQVCDFLSQHRDEMSEKKHYSRRLEKIINDAFDKVIKQSTEKKTPNEHLKDVCDGFSAPTAEDEFPADGSEDVGRFILKPIKLPSNSKVTTRFDDIEDSLQTLSKLYFTMEKDFYDIYDRVTSLERKHTDITNDITNIIDRHARLKRAVGSLASEPRFGRRFGSKAA